MDRGIEFLLTRFNKEEESRGLELESANVVGGPRRDRFADRGRKQHLVQSQSAMLLHVLLTHRLAILASTVPGPQAHSLLFRDRLHANPFPGI